MQFIATNGHISIFKLVDVAMRAALSGMALTRHAQMRGPGMIEVKAADRSLVTPTDTQVERNTRALLNGELDIAVYGEEMGESGIDTARNARYLAIIDPIDGTRPFANQHMGGSTIIICIYDQIEQRIVVTCIGCPGTGELWVAADGVTTLYHYDVEQFKTVLGKRTCRVWTYDPEISRPTVYVDNPNPFTRNGRPMMQGKDLDKLDFLIRNAELTKFAVGSNGLHHALLTAGGPVVGTITISIGGIQDLGGIAAVQAAGGKVAAFVLTENRTLQSVDAEHNLLMPGGYDFLVMGIDQVRLDQLVGMLASSLS